MGTNRMSMPEKFLDDNQKQIYLTCLQYILGLDTEIDDNKKEFMLKQIKDMGLNCKKATCLKKNLSAKEIAEQIKNITDIKIRRFILREMVLLAIADHELSDNEIATIYEIANKSGIKQDKVNDIFIWAAKGIEWEIEGSKLVNEDL